MQTTKISPKNATRAAEFLLFLDTSAIMQDYRQNANRYVETLKQAFNCYQILMQKSYLILFSRRTQITLLQNNLELVLRYTSYLSQILIPEAQAKLEDYLEHPEAPRPSIKMSFVKEEIHC